MIATITASSGAAAPSPARQMTFAQQVRARAPVHLGHNFRVGLLPLAALSCSVPAFGMWAWDNLPERVERAPVGIKRWLEWPAAGVAAGSMATLFLWNWSAGFAIAIGAYVVGGVFSPVATALTLPLELAADATRETPALGRVFGSVRRALGRFYAAVDRFDKEAFGDWPHHDNDPPLLQY